MILNSGTDDYHKLETAISHLVDVALPRAANIDEGIFFEASMNRQGEDIGTYKVTIERTRKP